MSRAPVGHDWRAAADPDDLREYDAFGPWIDRVTTPAGMPRRFRPAYEELARLGFLLKVPRNIDRAQARPGQDLYRSVLAVGADRLVSLELAPDGVRRRDVRLADVVATNVYTNLLVGVWTVFLADGTCIAVEYNTVGQAMIAHADRRVRHGSRLAGGIAGALPGSVDPVPVPDHYFSSVLAERRAAAEEAMVPVHVESPGRPCRDDGGRRRIGTGMMAITSPSDLVIVNRDEPARPRFRWGNYATNVLTVPFSRITGFALTVPPAQRPPRFVRLDLQCESHTLTQPCLTVPAGVVAALRAGGIPEG